jgi:glycerol-3-phosphate O-acyltransferase
MLDSLFERFAFLWSGSVAVPAWFAVIAGTLAVIGILDRLLIPSARWALKKRANKAIEELNTRLSLRIQPFKMTKRKALIDQLLFDPEVLAAVDAYAKEQGVPRDAAMDRARRYANEIVPSFSAALYFRVGTKLARMVSQSLYRVRLGYANPAALMSIDPNASVVFVINHRSNVDYIVVTYMASGQAALSYAVGEWAQIWPLSSLIRSMGAYFIRRNSKDLLYRKVVARYVAMATNAGVVQAVFPEGGLSRDGTLRPPKLGLLAYMVQSFDPKGPRDIIFIPVGLNYDRVLEDRNLTAAANLKPGEEPRFKFNPMVFVRYLAKMLGRKVTGRWYKNGYACVSFGEPVSMRGYLTARNLDFRPLSEDVRHREIEALGQHLTEAIGRSVPALPVPMVATALLDAGPGGLTVFELKGRVYSLMSWLEAHGTYVHIPRDDRDYAIDAGLRILRTRHLVTETNGVIAVNPADVVILRYYANSIAHLLPAEMAAARAA